MNVLEAMQQELANFNQLFYHVTLAVIFQVKTWSYSTFCCFVHWELVSTQLKNNPAFYLAIRQSFLNFLLSPLIHSAEQISGIGRDLPFSFIEVL